MKKKQRKKSLHQMYGDFIYHEPSMKKSQDALISDANASLREAYSDMENLLAKTYFMAENGLTLRSELKKIYSYAGKLSVMIEDFKYSLLR